METIPSIRKARRQREKPWCRLLIELVISLWYFDNGGFILMVRSPLFVG
jgi:hypothetical protein